MYNAHPKLFTLYFYLSFVITSHTFLMYTAHVHFFTNLDLFCIETRALSIEKYGKVSKLNQVSLKVNIY